MSNVSHSWTQVRYGYTDYSPKRRNILYFIYSPTPNYTCFDTENHYVVITDEEVIDLEVRCKYCGQMHDVYEVLESTITFPATSKEALDE